MAEYTINAEVRNKTGKGDSKRLKAAAKIPAVIYGKDFTPLHVAISRIEFEKTLKKANRNAIIEVKLDSSEGREVIVRDYQKHSISHLYTHVDFQAIKHDRPVKVDVELEFTGTAIGKKTGGIFTTLTRMLKVECLPAKIPAVIKLDVTNVDQGESLHASDITAGDFKVLTNPKVALCQVSKVKEEEEVAVDAAAAPAAAPAASK